MKIQLGLIVFILSILHISIQAQDVTLYGKISDQYGNPLSAVSLFMLHKADSSLYKFVISDLHGNYEIKNAKDGIYLMQSFQSGYSVYFHAFEILQGDSLRKLDIQLIKDNLVLPEFELKEERVPVKVGRDTVEFDALAFPGRQGDVVEDLLKKMPGIEVNRDGSIKAFGENVQNVLVDGKEFFGKDTRMATKNLDADAIDKVQVFDKLSESAEFTGIRDSKGERSLNLNLKPDKKNGYFGSAELAGGTAGRFKGRGNMHSFNRAGRWSAIGVGNNVNEQVFSLQDYIEFMGGIGALMSGGGGRIEINDDAGLPLSNDIRGIQRNIAAGLNWAGNATSKLESGAHYMFTNHQSRNENSIFSRQFIEQSFFDQLQEEKMNRLSNMHAVKFQSKWNIDSMNRIKVLFSGIIQDQNIAGTSIFENRRVEQSLGATSISEAFTSKVNNFKANAHYLTKLNNKGRSMGILLNGEMSNQPNTFNTNYRALLYTPSVAIDSLNQSLLDKTKSKKWGVEYNLTEALGRSVYISWLCQYFGEQQYSSDRYYTLTDSTQLNPLLSNEFDRKFSFIAAGPKLLISRNKMYFNAGVKFQQGLLEGSGDTNVKANKSRYKYLLPSMGLQYQIKTGNQVNLEFNSNVNAPNIQQMQPSLNNTNPLILSRGNPLLTPVLSYDLYLSYFKFDAFNFSSLFASGGVNFIKNPINKRLNIDSNFVSTAVPGNLDRSLTYFWGIDYQTPIRPLHIKIKAKWNARLENSIVALNGVENKFSADFNRFTASIENRKKDLVDIMLGSSYTKQKNNYSISSDWNNSFTEYRFFAQGDWNFLPWWNIGFSFDRLTFLQGNRALPDRNILAIQLSRYFLPQKKLKLSIECNDIFNQNTGFNRVVVANALNTEQYLVLKRYFMLNIHYSIRGFEKKKSGLEIKIED